MKASTTTEEASTDGETWVPASSVDPDDDKKYPYRRDKIVVRDSSVTTVWGLR